MSDLGPVVTVGDSGYEGGASEGGVSFQWFEPIEYLAKLIGTDDPRFVFWCETCGGRFQPQLVNMLQAASYPAPTYLCFTLACLNGGYVCEIFYNWVFSAFLARELGIQEKATCTDCGG